MEDESHQLHKVHALDGKHLEVDDGGWLHGPDVRIIPSVRHSALWPRETNILGIVWHHTDTRNAGAARLAARIQGYPENGQRAASWHVCIDRQGVIAQSVSATRGSWHAGGPTAARFASRQMSGGLDGRPHRVWELQPAAATTLPGANSLFFGIELENVGEVRLRDGEWLGWPFVRGDKARGEPTVVPADEVTFANNSEGRWHNFTSAQVWAAERVVAALSGRYALIRENCGWGHAQIDPKRRTDPGPVWHQRHLGVILLGVFGEP